MKLKSVVRNRFAIAAWLLAAIGVQPVAAVSAATAAPTQWSFGILADTQGASDPRGVSVRLMQPVIDRFANHHDIDLLISIGDLTEDGTVAEFNTWKQAAKPLTDAGIPLYLTRGNHDVRAESSTVGIDPLLGPSTSRGTEVWSATFPELSGPNVTAGPGASYSFTYNNTRFVSLDLYGAMPSELVGWAASQQKGSHDHMFVFAHEPFFGRAREGVIGDDPLRMQILSQLSSNGVDAYLSGHDHQYSRSAAVDGQDVLLHHFVAGSNAEKYYRFENEFNVGEEVGAALENNKVGYSVVDIDGPFVTFTYYSATPPASSDFLETWEPEWAVADRTTFSTNGHSYGINAGESYAGLDSSIAAGDGFIGTQAEILAGQNLDGRTVTTEPDSGDGITQKLGNIVNFGWRANTDGLHSDILYLGGMDDQLDGVADPFVLALSYGEDVAVDESLLRLMYLVDGEWVLAVEANTEGTPFFVSGAWNATYGLGTYGVDTVNNQVWAVIDRNGQFAVAAVPEPSAMALMLCGLGLLVPLAARRRRS
ncbi:MULTISPECIES: metallophosphoesterase [Methylobacillus]|uniref:Metallophosphoesterase n=1 Tax=Methylobacillus flagellatus (strain ATCC 51484 / DSM 6875 / VKM B-1610 / KT) TaxID=265072 RepID=Q1H2H5_METFK|nr:MULTISPECIES: metallophosphoesterase [Methylobacillus]ABE49168.1 metallophosphoesterase [Methylobacillus flagellatus KT]ABE49312.1 metallophosphoesterase [Methylobacillus flagellatus KT]MPS48119.1 metallophosphoesterase [Methylobacillus sp.]